MLTFPSGQPGTFDLFAFRPTEEFCMSMLLQHAADATGLVALGMNIRALLGVSDRHLMRASGIASALWALNNLLIGAHTAAALSALSVGRQATAEKLQDGRAVPRAVAFAILLVATLSIAWLTWEGPVSLFVVAGSVTMTWAVFYTRGAGLRLAMLAANAMWMVNAVAHDSWWQIAASVLVGGAAALGAWRARQAQRDVG
jgi:hypothetical protein